MDNNEVNNILAYKQLPEESRQQIHLNYFYGRKQYANQTQAFYRYMTQVYQESQTQSVIYKKFFLQCYQPNTTNELKNDTHLQSFKLNSDIYYLMGSLKDLKYNENKDLKKLDVCDFINPYFCAIHFEMRLPYTLNDNHFEELDKKFNNMYLSKKVKQTTENLNKEYVLLRDVSEQSYQTYLMNKNVIKLGESNIFAFETNMDPNLIRYFSVKNNNNKYFFDNKNQAFELIFVVGVQDQQIINENIFQYYQLDEEELKNLQKQYNPKTILKQAKTQLLLLKNAIRIKIFLCDFEVIVHPNTSNLYHLKQVYNQNQQDIFKDYIKQVELYETILQQLKYENDQWTFNMNKENNTFYKQANNYPDHFYLKSGQTAVIKCRTANVKLSFNPGGAEEDNQNQQ